MTPVAIESDTDIVPLLKIGVMLNFRMVKIRITALLALCTARTFFRLVEDVTSVKNVDGKEPSFCGVRRGREGFQLTEKENGNEILSCSDLLSATAPIRSTQNRRTCGVDVRANIKNRSFQENSKGTYNRAAKQITLFMYL